MPRHAPPFHRSLWALAAGALVATLLTDLVYWRTADFIWTDASQWLVSAGVVIGFVALIVGLIEAFAFSRRYAPPLPFAISAIAAWIVAVFDMLIHTHDSWTSVVPWGAALSALCVLLLLVAYVSTRFDLPTRRPLSPETAR